MVETIVLNYLSGALAVPVYMERPANASGSFCVVEKTGSSRNNHIDQATMAIQSYADTLVDAATLNEQVKQAMDQMAALAAVGRVALDSDYNFTDTSKKGYRYQAVYDVMVYEE